MLGLKNSPCACKTLFYFPLSYFFFSTIHSFRFYRRLKLIQNKFLHVQYCFEMIIGIKRIKELIKIHPLVDMMSMYSRQIYVFIHKRENVYYECI